MVTWQRRNSLGSRRFISVTAFGRSSPPFPFTCKRAARCSCFLLAGGTGAIGVGRWGYAELRLYGVLRSSRVDASANLWSEHFPAEVGVEAFVKHVRMKGERLVVGE